MNVIPPEKMDVLKQMSDVHGVKLADIQKFYETKINDETFTPNFPNQADLFSYVDSLLLGFIQDFVNSTMEEFEIIVIASSCPREAKTGSIFSNHTCAAKRTPEQIAENIQTGKAVGENGIKWLAIRNGEDSGILERITPLTTGRIKVSIGKEDERAIEAYSRSNSEFTPCSVSFVEESGKKEYIKKLIRNVTLAQAGSNLSAKDEKGYAISYSLRLIVGTMSGRRLMKNEKTKKETAIINIMDGSVAGNSEFFKNKQVPDPDNAGKTKIQYGGFSGFCEPDDIRELDRGTYGMYIGHITTANNMNVQTIIPIMAVIPKKNTEKLQKPGKPVVEAPPVAAVTAANI